MEYMKAIDKLLAPIKKLSMNALVANSSWLDSQVKSIIYFIQKQQTITNQISKRLKMLQYYHIKENWQ